MSCIAYDSQTDKYFVFAKGSPEKMKELSV
jgi:hypothetical protein